MKRKRTLFIILATLLLAASSSGAASWFKTIQVSMKPISFFFDGVKDQQHANGQYFNGTTNVPLAFNYEGTTYVPLRYVSEKLGKEIGFDSKTNSIWVGTKPKELSTQNNDHQSATGIYGVQIGQSANEVIDLLGQPQRKDLSHLGYEWWIYNKDLSKYVQVGIQNGKVVDLYSNASTWSYDGIKVGSKKEELNKFSAKQEVTFTYQNAKIHITNDLSTKPLFLIKDTPVIFYLDLHNGNRVTAIRMMSKEMLVKNKMYSLRYTYSGAAPVLSSPTPSKADQTRIDQGYEKQIFDLTNVVRLRNQLPILTWNEKAADVARKHSLDMLENQFFDHVSRTTGLDPFERMEKAGIQYRTAGENIAMGYSDGIEAFEGWMNSAGHRKNILESSFTTLGVGVHQDYYTQNFVTPASN